MYLRAQKEHPYYNYSKLLSYNARYNFLSGARGLGKTFGAKENSIKKFLKAGEQFIYLRRYKTELTVAKNTFFDDLLAKGKFPDHDFKVEGNRALVAPKSSRDDKKREWLTMGYFIALSTAQGQKSVAFPLVTTIIFDEFIIEKGLVQYLPSEAAVFNNFYSTVDRYQDKTRVLFLANAVSINNPYFIAYKIAPDEGSEFVVRSGGFIVAHFPEAADFQTSVYATEFGKFIADTEYAKYAVGNTFADNNDSLIAFKDGRARYVFTIETKNGSYSVWHDVFSDDYFIQGKLPKQQVLFTIVPERMSEEKMLLTFSDRPLANLRHAFRTGKVFFDEPSTRNTFIGVFSR